MEWVRWFADIGQHDIAMAGGKGANLGEMAQAGLPVPPGFVLTTRAYDAFVEANGLLPEVLRLVGAVQADDPGSAERAAIAIRARFEAGAIPPEVAVAVRESYARLGNPAPAAVADVAVAVRSSATAEDLPGASFAGQQETYLNVAGPEQVLTAVRRCWSSLWTARAIAYRARQGVTPDTVALAVVVQRLVAAESAGVLFTANPVNGRRDQMVVDAAWGLGEALVSGQVTPDHWVLATGTGAVVESRVAHKEVGTTVTAAGTATLPIAPDLQDKPALSEPQLAAVLDLGRQVAAHYDSPQDIEWAFAGGQLFLLQSRPITSLFPLPTPLPPAVAGVRIYVSANIMQGVLEPLTPMGIAAFQALARGPAELAGFHFPPDQTPPAFCIAAGRMYFDATNALRHPRGRAAIMGVSYILDPPLGPIVEHLLASRPELAKRGPLPLHPRARLLLGILARGLAAQVRPERALTRMLARLQAQADDRDAEAARLSGVAARVAFVRRVLPGLFPQMLRELAPVLIPALAARFVTESRLRKWLGNAPEIEAILRSLPHNPTTEMDLELWRLSRRLKAEGAEPSAGHPGVQAFLERYGHRAVREIDLGMPRWWNDPSHVLNVLRGYLAHGDENDPERQFAEGARAAEAALQSLVERVRQQHGPLRASLVRLALRRVRQLAGLREFPKFYIVRALALSRRVLQGAGEELVAAGRLDRADDVFFLHLNDLTAPDADLRALAAANRAEYEREMGRRAIPRVITSEGETFYAAPAAPGGTPGALTGTASSPGAHEGRVRIVRDPGEARLQPGDVLVAPGTDPAWTPLFFTAGAIVTETGGMMSHGSVVAREYGIPAVVGISDVTRLLREGQRVRVDGDRGEVVILSDTEDVAE